ncbi:MAG: 30S ribosomal protein S1 [Chloroflexi bacterium]|nr:30S ribosomal protein S1 [Chloroflexota bacterium]
MKYKEHPEAEQKVPRQPPELDDSWWAAVLADEDKMPTSHSKPLDGKSNASLELGEEADWEAIQGLLTQEEVMDCEVVGFNRGGLLVDGEGFHGFVPLSHLVDHATNFNEVEREEHLAGYVGAPLTLKIIECDPQRGRVVLSERAAQTEPGTRQALFENLSIGNELTGKVTNVTEFGVFVDLGGVEGLVHISELSWGRVGHPDELARMGDEIEVLVLSIDRHRGRVALSRKRLYPNPWESAVKQYPIGCQTEVTITDVVDFGAFARLEEGLEGLIHITEMGVSRRVDPTFIVQVGEQVLVRVLHVDPARQRMSLRLEYEDATEKKGPSTDSTDGVDG